MDRPRNDSPPPTRIRYGVLGFMLVLTAIAYLDRICISTAAPAMKADLGLNDAQMGRVFSAFTFAYALMEVPSGWLADRFGTIDSFLIYGVFMLPLCGMLGLIMHRLKQPASGNGRGC